MFLTLIIDCKSFCIYILMKMVENKRAIIKFFLPQPYISLSSCEYVCHESDSDFPQKKNNLKIMAIIYVQQFVSFFYFPTHAFTFSAELHIYEIRVLVRRIMIGRIQSGYLICCKNVVQKDNFKMSI